MIHLLVGNLSVVLEDIVVRHASRNRQLLGHRQQLRQLVVGDAVGFGDHGLGARYQAERVGVDGTYCMPARERLDIEKGEDLGGFEELGVGVLAGDGVGVCHDLAVMSLYGLVALAIALIVTRPVSCRFPVLRVIGGG